ncbi:MAG TPA: hypothetical protein VKA85_11315 [Candidatus Limnocylindrales bacterium]|nr:hypothetical protein [Candidatus Limnocylindrales bacterium]
MRAGGLVRRRVGAPIKLLAASLHLVPLALATGILAAAASLSVSSGTVGAATVATPRCTAVGLTVLQNLSAGTVVSVTVGGLPAACGGATLQATVNNGSTFGSGSVAVPAGGGSVTVPLGAAPAVTAAETTDIVVLGP